MPGPCLDCQEGGVFYLDLPVLSFVRLLPLTNLLIYEHDILKTNLINRF